MTDYKALAGHHSEETVHLLEEYSVANLEIAHHLHQYEVEQKAIGLQAVDIVELPDNQPEEHESVLSAQGEPKLATSVPTDA